MDVNGDFSVDVLNVILDGSYMVIVSVLDDVGNIIIIFDIGMLDISVFVLILDV